jgi:SulP family sulfate permease
MRTGRDLARDLSRRFGVGSGSVRSDAVAGLVLGVESVPDGLATGLLAGVNPIAGLYGYLVGTVAGSLGTSSAFMAIQGTGAMAVLVADVPEIHHAHDPQRALFTLSVLTGAVMLAAGLLRLGTILRFVSNSVMVGFISAVGVNIMLGQLSNLTGYSGRGPNRLVRAIDTFLHPGQFHWASVLIGTLTIAMIVAFGRTRVGALGMVIAVLVGSALVPLLGFGNVTTLKDLGVVPSVLPTPVAPSLQMAPALIIPALSLAFVGLVQGAGVSANFLNPDGSQPDASRDFAGQGIANIASGLLRGMPVGGSVSATSINVGAGARSRLSLVLAGIVMAVSIVVFGDLVSNIAMPALAGLLILVGYRTIKPEDLVAVWRTGAVQQTVLSATFVLTIVIPLQYAVLIGVALSIVLYVAQESSALTLARWELEDDGTILETDPPAHLGECEIVVLQPYGSLFFAAADRFDAALPTVDEGSRHSVVIVRLRGQEDLGTTFIDVLARYAQSLADVDSRLLIASAGKRVRGQLAASGLDDLIGAENIYRGRRRLGASVRDAYADARRWIGEREQSS